GRPGCRQHPNLPPRPTQHHAAGVRAVTCYAAFLRGVNVGGVTLKMAEVAAAFEEAGFDSVRTVLASGNVVLQSRSGVDAVRTRAQDALRRTFGYDAWVL